MIVADASVILEVLLGTAAAQKVLSVLEREDSLAAPHVIDLEVAQVLRRAAAAGTMDAERGREAIADLLDFPLIRYPHDVLLPRIWELRANVTAYDAAYLALAETLGARLVTRDARLAGAPGHRARVLVV